MAHVDFQVACCKDAISSNHRIDSSSGDLNGDEEDGDSLEASSIDNTKAGNTIDKHELNQVVTLPANSKISKVKPKSKQPRHKPLEDDDDDSDKLWSDAGTSYVFEKQKTKDIKKIN